MVKPERYCWVGWVGTLLLYAVPVALEWNLEQTMWDAHKSVKYCDCDVINACSVMTCGAADDERCLTQADCIAETDPTDTSCGEPQGCPGKWRFKRAVIESGSNNSTIKAAAEAHLPYTTLPIAADINTDRAEYCVCGRYFRSEIPLDYTQGETYWLYVDWNNTWSDYHHEVSADGYDNKWLRLMCCDDQWQNMKAWEYKRRMADLNWGTLFCCWGDSNPQTSCIPRAGSGQKWRNGIVHTVGEWAPGDTLKCFANDINQEYFYYDNDLALLLHILRCEDGGNCAEHTFNTAVPCWETEEGCDTTSQLTLADLTGGDRRRLAEPHHMEKVLRGLNVTAVEPQLLTPELAEALAAAPTHKLRASPHDGL